MEDCISIIESELKMPAMSLPVKTTIVSVGGSVVLISPIPNLADFKKEVEVFGEPTDIVAPSGFHHLGIKAAAELYPSAKLWGVPVLKTKRRDIYWHKTLPEDWPYTGTLDVFPLDGMPKIDEMIFYHHPSKTLIVSDLCFNHVHGKGLGNWIIFNMFGTYRRFAISKFFTKFIKGKDRFRESIEKILSLDIQKIVIPHGVNVTENAKEKLVQALKERHLI